MTKTPIPAPTVTVLEVIEQMADRLDAAGLSFADGYGQGTTNAFDEAAWLVLWKLGLEIDDLESVENRPVAPEDQAQVALLVDQRISTRQPAAYLTNEAWLMGVPFYVDERVIIPRSLIAELLDDGSIDDWLSDETLRVLDLCTGNGSLAVLAAMAYPEVVVDAADISRDALDVARINVERHQLGSRITLVESDGLAACPGPYDLILCNPPYVNAASMAALPAEFRAEPGLALSGNMHGGSDGMDFIRGLFLAIAAQMNENAVLVLEIGNERENFVRAFPHLEPLWFETSAGPDQVLLLTREQLA
ncbi:MULTISPECIES: 50S ribosomal protein L3 N(5)-glutamine methyltransferase [unclassified Polaromonas]|jgi:ribosomal protein L3 glutamine methyltransferase|uniref:50S ribosomal protein L3 N(5)-glutamine methyltransferase n=1 Tax=unclassified Polaromonas TaxID=2638319 RepID=UPI0018CB00DB|nr:MULTISPECIES: 50S ribosomal protein L3 N(5)-glutamine methyltransferase [unclassified Polaromonas]MBG6072822.1 ribosomal protein L3 glutamine methyltransferase [Polaromonas sp. CG_9.7]MBG6114827.1 ribosomal protein L3 glutamine methyltransferase [Polaromonas sp. CG_9.2]